MHKIPIQLSPIVLQRPLEYLHRVVRLTSLDLQPGQLDVVGEREVPPLQVPVQQVEQVVSADVSPLVQGLRVGVHRRDAAEVLDQGRLAAADVALDRHAERSVRRSALVLHDAVERGFGPDASYGSLRNRVCPGIR